MPTSGPGADGELDRLDVGELEAELLLVPVSPAEEGEDGVGGRDGLKKSVICRCRLCGGT